VNPEKTKYMLMSRSQKVGQRHSIKIANGTFEEVAEQNWMHEEIKSGECLLPFGSESSFLLPAV
jgi:hypothetical protein